MIDRLTDRARRALVLAQDQARSLSHSSVSNGHLLLGLLAEGEGVAARALTGLGVEADVARNWVFEQLAPSATDPEGQIPFTQDVKRAMELAEQEALNLGHNYIGTEHLLLGLLHDTDGAAAQMLTTLSVDAGAARLNIMQLLADLGLSPSDPEEGHPDEPLPPH